MTDATVSLPGRQTRNLTVLVFTVSIAVGLYITVFDLIFLRAVSLIPR